MPSYCSAVNCKNNGIANPELSFFKFPTHRKDVASQWIEAMRRKNWTPTIYSRVCSMHFEENCFFAKKGSRLRLLPDSIPTVFDFRKIPSNRKKAEEYLDMTETECPDPELYQLQVEQVAVRTAKSGQRCQICNGPADCDMQTGSMVITKQGKISLAQILESIGSVHVHRDRPGGYICLSCSQRLVNAYLLRCEIAESNHFPAAPTAEPLPGPSTEQNAISIANSSAGTIPTIDPSPVQQQFAPRQQYIGENIIYCSSCDVNLLRSDLGVHLLTCKMKEAADREGIPQANRRLFVCCICQFLVYRHQAVEHTDRCCGKSNLDFATRL